MKNYLRGAANFDFRSFRPSCRSPPSPRWRRVTPSSFVCENNDIVRLFEFWVSFSVYTDFANKYNHWLQMKSVVTWEQTAANLEIQDMEKSGNQWKKVGTKRSGLAVGCAKKLPVVGISRTSSQGASELGSVSYISQLKVRTSAQKIEIPRLKDTRLKDVIRSLKKKPCASTIEVISSIKNYEQHSYVKQIPLL